MTNNDYFVIVYRLLSYFYECLKNGETPNIDEFSPEALRVNKTYWANIMDDLISDGYVRNIISSNPRMRISSKGIEYLQTDSMMKKTKEVLCEIKEIVPGF